MKTSRLALGASMIICYLFAGTNESKNTSVIDIDFNWQQIDKGAQENTEIRMTGVPPGTKRFLVSLVDLNLNGFDHGKWDRGE